MATIVKTPILHRIYYSNSSLSRFHIYYFFRLAFNKRTYTNVSISTITRNTNNIFYITIMCRLTFTMEEYVMVKIAVFYKNKVFDSISVSVSVRVAFSLIQDTEYQNKCALTNAGDLSERIELGLFL